MYANQYGPASPPPGLSSNPFIGDPTTAHARFPDLASSNISASQSQPQLQSGYPNAYSGYGNQPPQYQAQYQQYTSQPYVQQYQTQPQVMSPQNQFASTSYPSQYPGQMGPQPTGYSGFQPTSAFGHQLQSQPQPQPQQYSNLQYSGGYPQQQANPGYLAEFDPYAQQTQTHQTTQSQVAQPHGAAGTGPTGVTHPRDFIRIHKSGLEAWDSYSWKQLFNAFEALKDVWSARKQQAETVVRQHGGNIEVGLFGPDPAFGYSAQIEGWKQVLKDANDNVDIVAASMFQLHEVFNSYRQSGDPASKRRVRESCNAALKGLPDWPSN